MKRQSQRKLSPSESESLLKILEKRFSENMHRHPDEKWSEVEKRLRENPSKLWSINEMELTSGEPDVFDVNAETGVITFFDFSPESPAGRRSFCYDTEALIARKKYKPDNSAMARAEEMGVQLLTEKQYFELQEREAVDNKTSSWLATPPEVRKLGGAIFGDRRFGRVFIYHNGAESFYAARGFRSSLLV